MKIAISSVIVNNKFENKCFVSILEKSKEYGTYQIDFTGGEPLMYKDFDKLLEYCYLNGFLVRIFTNLTLFNENFLRMGI